MALQVVSANRLDDGRVVYLAWDGGWSERLADAHVADSDEEAAWLLAGGQRAAAADIVVDPYLVDMVHEAGILLPARYRERLRALGPSVRPDLARAQNPASDREAA